MEVEVVPVVDLIADSAKKGGRQKGVHPHPQKKTMTKRGILRFVDRKISTYMSSLASIQRPSRMYALPRYTILHVFTITVSEQPNARRPVVLRLTSHCGTSTLSPKAKRTYGLHI